jgi:hypothetical protein
MCSVTSDDSLAKEMMVSLGIVSDSLATLDFTSLSATQMFIAFAPDSNDVFVLVVEPVDVVSNPRWMKSSTGSSATCGETICVLVVLYLMNDKYPVQLRVMLQESGPCVCFSSISWAERPQLEHLYSATLNMKISPICAIGLIYD